MSYNEDLANVVLDRLIQANRDLAEMREKVFTAYNDRDKARAEVRELQAKLDGYLTVEEALEQAIEDEQYVFDDDAPNGVSKTIENEAVYGEEPPFITFNVEQA